MANDEKTKNLNENAKELRHEMVEVSVAALAALAALKANQEACGTNTPPPPPTLDTLYDLSRLHVKTVAKLATLSAEHTNEMVTFLKERAEKQRAAASRTRGCDAPAAKVLVRLKTTVEQAGSATSATFRISNADDTQPKRYVMPDVLEFVAASDLGSERPNSHPVAVQFLPDIVQLERATPTQRKHQEVTLRLLERHGLAAGTYRAVAPLGGNPRAEVIVELVVG